VVGESCYAPTKGGEKLEVKEKRTSANFLNKKKLVSEIEQLAREAKSMIAMDYKTITVAEDTALRNKFREKNVKYKIYKDNLVRIALNNLGITELDEKLKGTLSFAFSMNDEISAAQVVSKENFKNKMAFQFGLVGTSVLDAAEVNALATLPSKETLIAQLLGLIQSSARNLAATIQAVPRNIAAVVNAHVEQPA
jgi:large subunit ribosomal protein L10